MSVRRVMGTEVEYGIAVQGQPLANPMVASPRTRSLVCVGGGDNKRATGDLW